MINLNETPKAILEANEGDKFVIDGDVYEFFKTPSSLAGFEGDFYLCKPMPEHIRTLQDDVFYFRNSENSYASMTKEEMLRLLVSQEYILDSEKNYKSLEWPV